MSAYGAVTVTNKLIDLLPPTTWDLPQPTPGKPVTPFCRLVLHHLRLESACALPAGPSLLEYTHRTFAAEVEAGRTYPQEADALALATVAAGSSSLSGESDDLSGSGASTSHTGIDSGTHDDATQARSTQAYTRAAFEAYFWAADVIVAIGQTDASEVEVAADGDGGIQSDHGGELVTVPNSNRAQQNLDILNRSASAVQPASEGDLLEISRGGRDWEDALVGFYYVKPNYPGRSSHICNAGFIIPPAHREFGYGKTLGKSYLHYGPALGYKASVFNLVYANNTGSLRIWDSLGFTRAGLIPRAGRLRRADGNGEEWVDSVIYYRSFVEEEEWTRPIEPEQ